MENTSCDSMAALPKALEFPQRNGPSHHADRVRPCAALRVVPSETVQDLDHFVERDGLRFAGTHLIIDLWQRPALNKSRRRCAAPCRRPARRSAMLTSIASRRMEVSPAWPWPRKAISPSKPCRNAPTARLVSSWC